jgi:hypothetical protein
MWTTSVDVVLNLASTVVAVIPVWGPLVSGGIQFVQIIREGNQYRVALVDLAQAEASASAFGQARVITEQDRVAAERGEFALAAVSGIFDAGQAGAAFVTPRKSGQAADAGNAAHAATPPPPPPDAPAPRGPTARPPPQPPPDAPPPAATPAVNPQPVAPDPSASRTFRDPKGRAGANAGAPPANVDVDGKTVVVRPERGTPADDMHINDLVPKETQQAYQQALQQQSRQELAALLAGSRATGGG